MAAQIWLFAPAAMASHQAQLVARSRVRAVIHSKMRHQFSLEVLRRMVWQCLSKVSEHQRTVLISSVLVLKKQRQGSACYSELYCLISTMQTCCHACAP